MGVADLWSLLKPAFDERVSLKEFCADFVSKSNRPPRFAIDANILLFQSTHRSIPSVVELKILIRNFMSKLLAFVSLNISFVVVFDGRLKPHKLRNGPAPVGDFDFERDYEGLLELFCSIKPLDYAEGFALIETIRRNLENLKIDYIQAPAEAEAQCAHLQKHGIVDYVLTNDGDTFIFGASNILRNLSKYSEDVTVSPSKVSKSQASDEYFVTPVRMERVEALTGLSTWRLIFLVCLRGGDYSLGAKQIGITIAKKLALCGTAFADINLVKAKTNNNTNKIDRSNKDQNITFEVPDFVELFRKCLTTEVGHQFFLPWSHVADATSRVESLRKFEKGLHVFVTANAGVIFGRNVTFANAIRICPDTALFYSNPFVDRRIYKFYPQTLSFAEVKHIKNDLRLPPFHGTSIAGDTVEIVRTNSVYGTEDHRCGKLVVHIAFEKNGTVEVTENNYQGETEISLPYLSVAPTYDGKIKAIVGRLLSHVKIADRPVLDYLFVSRKKEINNIEYLMIKFETDLLYEVFPLAALVASEPSPTKHDSEDFRENSKSPSKSSWSSLWLPQVMVRLLNPHMADVFAQQTESPRKKSPRKFPIKPTQKTTLDHFGSFLESPTKRACASLMPLLAENGFPSFDTSVRLAPPLVKVATCTSQQQLSFSTKNVTTDANPFLDTGGSHSAQSDDDLFSLLRQVDENVLKFENSRKLASALVHPVINTDFDVSSNSIISVNSGVGEDGERLGSPEASHIIVISSQED